MLDTLQLSHVFYFVGLGLLGVVGGLLYWLYRRVTETKTATQNVTAANLTEMAILFQTMRGIVHEQKSLAREFNESVDKKVTLIRQVIGKVVEEHNSLCEAHRDVSEKLNAIGRELDAVRNEVDRLREEVSGGAPAQAPAMPETEPPLKRGKPAEMAPLRIVVDPMDNDSPSELAELWVGFDFVGQESEAFEVPETPPEAPGDPEVTRQAFRALLSMSGEGSHAESRRESSVASETLTVDSGNGRGGRAASLRGRVYDYNDAGMSVAEIAQELGIGKGEVRLMLSLREKGKR